MNRSAVSVSVQIVGYDPPTGPSEGATLSIASDGDIRREPLEPGTELSYRLRERTCAGTVADGRHIPCSAETTPYCVDHTDRWACARCIGDCSRPLPACREEHAIYLAAFAPDRFKVGVTRSWRLQTRLYEQGADRAAHLRTVPDGRIARQVEADIASGRHGGGAGLTGTDTGRPDAGDGGSANPNGDGVDGDPEIDADADTDVTRNSDTDAITDKSDIGTFMDIVDRVRVHAKVDGLHRRVDDDTWQLLLERFDPIETWEFEYGFALATRPMAETIAAGTVRGLKGRILVIENAGGTYAVDGRDLVGHHIGAGGTDRALQSSFSAFE